MKKSLKLPTILIYVTLFLFLIYFIFQKNIEFLGYTFVAGFLYFVVISSDKKYNFPIITIWFFGLWAVFHMLGGSVYISGTRLYDLVLINIYDGGGEFLILKYDQVMHSFIFFTISIMFYFALKFHMKKVSKVNLFVFSVLCALGVGLIHEIIEFGMVVFADAAEAVGGYYNTALDLVFNFIGAVMGSFFAMKLSESR